MLLYKVHLTNCRPAAQLYRNFRFNTQSAAIPPSFLMLAPTGPPRDLKFTGPEVHGVLATPVTESCT